jgi:antitoxin (DNA-binding transcriptional repressor) of toxin-antitoxin stability system
MNSNVKGAVAEQAIVLAATKLGVPVLRPVAEHGRTDLALEIGGDLFRVQVKWGRLSRARDVVIAAVRTSRCTPRGHIYATYSEHEVDLFAVYCGELDRCFLLPASLLVDKTVVHLRLTAARNGQQACINLADDFTFDGAVAQLARATRWQRVGQGFESPQLHSSDSHGEAVTIGAESCRVSLGYWLDQVAAGEDVIVTRRGKPLVRMTAAGPASPPGMAATAPLSTPGQIATAPLSPPLALLSPETGAGSA